MPDITPRLTAAQYLSLQRAPRAPVSRSTPRKSKYGNARTEGYDSAKEARVHAMLDLLRNAADADARVTEIQTQVNYLLIPAQPGERATTYRADFVVTYASGRVEVIDVKSEVTRRIPSYVIKRKLMLARHGIRLREI